MENIIKPQISKITEKENDTAIFEIKPCYPGFGITIGNALRRVLFSSLPGAAITSFKIKGANHEFTSIPNVMEDVTQLIINLKKIRIKMNSSEEVTATIKVSGEKKIKAGDIEVPSNVEIVNKNLHIAALTDKKAELEMTLTIQKGIGYVPAEKMEGKDAPIGTISIDALFSPIIKVNYDVEDMRVGQMTNYNKINFEIQTDGTITPKEAMDSATEILINQFKSIAGKSIESETEEKAAEQTSEIEEKDEDADNPEALKVSELDISKRTIGALEENKIKTVSKLASKSKNEISELPGLGAKGVEEIISALTNIGLSLKE